MIRERVSTRGLIRPLEPAWETDLPAMQVPSDHIGTLPERTIEQYLTAKECFDRKFAQAIKRIEKQRLQNIDRASWDMNQHTAAVQHLPRSWVPSCCCGLYLEGHGYGPDDEDDI
jgi:hypothetical protein